MSAEVDWMYTFILLPVEERLPLLVERQQGMVDALSKNNRASKAIAYAFLDEAWGDHAWRVDNVSKTILAQIRGRNLRDDKITEPWHIDVLYGAFFGSGDPAFLRPIVRLLRDGPPQEAESIADRAMLVTVAEWSMNSLSGAYPHFEAAVEVAVAKEQN